MKWRKLCNEELNELYCSPHSIQVIKSRRIRWAGLCSMYEGEQRCIQGLNGETREQETTWKTQA